MNKLKSGIPLHLGLPKGNTRVSDMHPKKKNFGPDLSSNLAVVLLGLDNTKFRAMSSSSDIRGFVEIYLEDEIQLTCDSVVMNVKNVCCGFQHFSFLAKDVYVDVYPSMLGHLNVFFKKGNINRAERAPDERSKAKFIPWLFKVIDLMKTGDVVNDEY